MFNSCLNSLSKEIHVPGYTFLGPGTKLEERLKRGDQPINPLDAAAREHDIFYSRYKDREHRHIADGILEKKAWKRVISSDANLSERGVALLTAGAMKAKRKLGLGLLSASASSRKLKRIARKKNKKTKSKGGLNRQRGQGGGGKPLSFSHVVNKARSAIKRVGKNTSPSEMAMVALNAVHSEIQKKRVKKLPRVIPIPKVGGMLPLIPILAGISALGGAASGVSSIVKAVGDVIEAKRRIFPGSKTQIGNGIYLAPYKKNGFGLYLTPYNRSANFPKN